MGRSMDKIRQLESKLRDRSTERSEHDDRVATLLAKVSGLEATLASKEASKTADEKLARSEVVQLQFENKRLSDENDQLRKQKSDLLESASPTSMQGNALLKAELSTMQ